MKKAQRQKKQRNCAKTTTTFYHFPINRLWTTITYDDEDNLFVTDNLPSLLHTNAKKKTKKKLPSFFTASTQQTNGRDFFFAHFCLSSPFFFVYFEFNLSILLIPNFFFVYRRPDGSFFFQMFYSSYHMAFSPPSYFIPSRGPISTNESHHTHYSTVRRRMINRVFGMLFYQNVCSNNRQAAGQLCVFIIIQFLF